MFSVEPDGDGLYRVVDSDGVVLHESLSNRDAWRKYDEIEAPAPRAEVTKRKRRKTRKNKRQRKAAKSPWSPRPSKTGRSGAKEDAWKDRHTSGAAGPCKRICPKTGRVIEVIG